MNNGFEDALVHVVEAVVIDLDHGQGGICDVAGNGAIGADLGVVARVQQQIVGMARGATRAGGNFAGAFWFNWNPEQTSGAEDDGSEVFDGIIIEPQVDAEA